MRSIICAAAAALLLMPVAALADQPQAASRAAFFNCPETKPAPTRAASATSQQAPFYPRWIAPSVTISGLTVWTFRPGHFQGQ